MARGHSWALSLSRCQLSRPQLPGETLSTYPSMAQSPLCVLTAEASPLISDLLFTEKAQYSLEVPPMSHMPWPCAVSASRTIPSEQNCPNATHNARPVSVFSDCLSLFYYVWDIGDLLWVNCRFFDSPRRWSGSHVISEAPGS